MKKKKTEPSMDGGYGGKSFFIPKNPEITLFLVIYATTLNADVILEYVHLKKNGYS